MSEVEHLKMLLRESVDRVKECMKDVQIAHDSKVAGKEEISKKLLKVNVDRVKELVEKIQIVQRDQDWEVLRNEAEEILKRMNSGKPLVNRRQTVGSFNQTTGEWEIE